MRARKFKDENLLRPEAPLRAVDFLENKKSDLESLQITLEEIALFLKMNFNANLVAKDDLMKKLKEVCYVEEVRRRKKSLKKYMRLETRALTLQSIICFCVAKPSSKLYKIPDSQIEKGKKSKHKKPPIETNPKVGGIPTTNYDNLLEASFDSKFGRKGMLKSVGRVTSR